MHSTNDDDDGDDYDYNYYCSSESCYRILCFW